MPYAKEIFIYDRIGPWEVSAESIKGELDAAGDGPVLVRINSVGGTFTDGPAIFTLLRSRGVDTTVDGVAYSMAGFLAQAGVTRKMTSSAVLMLHGAQYVAEGSAEEIRKTADMMEAHNQAMVEGLVSRGIDRAKAETWIMDGEDHAFTASEAVKEGLADEIVDPVDIAATKVIHQDSLTGPLLAAMKFAGIAMPSNETKDDSPGNTENTRTPAIEAASVKRNYDATLSRGVEEGSKQEARRQREIREFFARSQFCDPDRIGDQNTAIFAELRDKCLEDMNVKLDDAREAALDLQAGIPAPILSTPLTTQRPKALQAMSPRRQKGAVEMGVDERDKFLDAATKVIETRTSVIKGREDVRAALDDNEYAAFSVYELASKYLQLTGQLRPGRTRERIVGDALVAEGIAHGTSDFASLFENVANKQLLRGWDEAPETWMTWARSGSNPDFKPASRVNLSTFGDLSRVEENGEYQYGTFSDLKERLTLETHGKLFGISRQALANDDLGALSRIPMLMGRAAARKVGDLVYDVLVSNPVMLQDSTTLFHANHNNIGTAGPIDAAPGGTLDEAYTAMATQKDPAGNTLNIMGVYLIVPRALEVSTRATIADANYTQENAGATAMTTRTNPFRDRFTVVADARLDDASTTAWYMAANQDIHDTVEAAFLNGIEAPYLESKDGWNTDGVEYKVRIDATAGPLDFRGLFKNDGA